MSDAANGIMTSAIIDDIASLALVAVVIPIATGTGDLSVAGIAAIVLRALLFFVLIVVIATWIMPHSAEKGLLKRYPFLQRFGMVNLLAIDNGSKATLGIYWSPFRSACWRTTWACTRPSAPTWPA